MSTKYIFVTGGVASSLGKGITAASLGRLLKARGYSVVLQKFDPYLNVDPGTMNPYQHGEVFVTEDGMETDLDLGHYERFIDENLTRYSSVTSGQIFYSVLNRERSGGYNGGTVQIIPHITDEIKDKLHRIGQDRDVVITEIGGTIGDIEGQPFIEAIRQFQWENEPSPRSTRSRRCSPWAYSPACWSAAAIIPSPRACAKSWPASATCPRAISSRIWTRNRCIRCR